MRINHGYFYIEIKFKFEKMMNGHRREREGGARYDGHNRGSRFHCKYKGRGEVISFIIFKKKLSVMSNSRHHFCQSVYKQLALLNGMFTRF